LSGAEGDRARRPHLPALTSLRFFAALYVVIYHLWRWDAWRAPAVVVDVVAAGPIAVTFFFVLSGFVLTWTYELDGRLRGGARAFWRARAARVYPVYAFGLLVSAPVVLALWARAGGGREAFVHELVGGVAAFFMVQAFHPDFALAWNPPAWSLSAEAFFYLLFPAAAPWLLAARRPRVVGVALWVLSLAPSVAYLALSPDGLDGVDHRVHAPWSDALKYHPLARLPELLLGVLAARAYLGGLRLPAAAGWGALFACLVVVGSGAVPYALLHNGLLAPLFVVALISLAPSAGALAARPLLRLGEASYALYILHVPLFYWVAGAGERRTGEKVLERPAVAIATVLAAVVISLVVYRLFEAPLRARLRGRR
jgi:peptidoglycan/LPS O-acetylase OafA/YrhL